MSANLITIPSKQELEEAFKDIPQEEGGYRFEFIKAMTNFFSVVSGKTFTLEKVLSTIEDKVRLVTSHSVPAVILVYIKITGEILEKFPCEEKMRKQLAKKWSKVNPFEPTFRG